MLLLALCALQQVIISLAQHYGVPGMRYVQPITATLIAPLAWIAFVATAVRHFTPRDYVHLAGPILALLAILLYPALLDLIIPVLFTGYGLAIILEAKNGSDALPRMRIEAGDLPGRIWIVIGAALTASAFSDVLIAGAQIMGAAYLQPWIISIYSSGMLMIVGLLSLSGALRNAESQPEPELRPEVSEIDTEIVAKLDALMERDRLYLNPDLTLTQLSRKMLIPVKQLSSAINKVTGENVSRYINGARIRTAQKALQNGENVTDAMLSSGFNTKSNFNREFLRIVGMSPSDWIATQSANTTTVS